MDFVTSDGVIASCPSNDHSLWAQTALFFFLAPATRVLAIFIVSCLH